MIEPVKLFGETDLDTFKRLRELEIHKPEVNLGFRNDFQEAMEQVDQAYLNEILSSEANNKLVENKDKDTEDSESMNVSWGDITKMAAIMGKSGREYDMNVITVLLEYILNTWECQISRSQDVMTAKVKMNRVIFTQTKEYLKPLFRKLKNKKLPADILDSLSEICKNLVNRNYISASDAYLEMAIGNAPWPIGVTMVGIHARTGREKIFSKNVAHVMNDETQRKYIEGLKRLMTKCQEYFPADPSKCVEYVP